MLDSNMLLDAMTGIPEEQILEAGRLLQWGEAAPVRRRRKLWTALLVAAVLVSLFTVTAYALGLFQMSGQGGRQTFRTQIGEQQLEWSSEYTFTFEGPEQCQEIRFQITWAPDEDYWFPEDWADGWTELVEGREIYDEEYGVYMPSCVVDIHYAPQFVQDGALVLQGFQPQKITREIWGEVEVYKFRALSTHAIDREQTVFPTGNFVMLFHPEQGWIIGVRGYDSMENLEGIARGLVVEPTGNTVRSEDFEIVYDICDIYIG